MADDGHFQAEFSSLDCDLNYHTTERYYYIMMPVQFRRVYLAPRLRALLSLRCSGEPEVYLAPSISLKLMIAMQSVLKLIVILLFIRQRRPP